MFRNNKMRSFANGVWNMVFVGSQGAPQSHCSNSGGGPYTTVDSTPVIAEKPYIIRSGSGFSLMRPRVEKNKVGPTQGYENADEIPFSKVYVANERDSAAKINQKLAEGNHLVLQPGQYRLTDTIKVTKANTVVLGMGLATLISTTGKPCIEVGNVSGVRIASILFQAGQVETPALLKWGNGKFDNDVNNPGVASDIFSRVGGPDRFETRANINIQINSGNIVVDETWLWRADHDVTGLVRGSKNPSKTGIQINGNDVVGYALMSEHHLNNLLEWNGERGRTYFY